MCLMYRFNVYLVGGIPTPLKNMKVNWDDDIPNIWENKKCSKPPTRYHVSYVFINKQIRVHCVRLDMIGLFLFLLMAHNKYVDM